MTFCGAIMKGVPQPKSPPSCALTNIVHLKMLGIYKSYALTNVVLGGMYGGQQVWEVRGTPRAKFFDGIFNFKT